MSVLVQGNQLRALLLGVRVEKATMSAPQSTSTDVFTVSGGKVVLTSLTGVVTTAVGATTVNYNLTHTPTGGSAADLVAATACTSDAVGTIYTMTGVPADTFGDSAVADADDVPVTQYGWLLDRPMVLPAGALKWKTSASTTGAVTWTATYIPLDDGASMVAA